MSWRHRGDHRRQQGARDPGELVGHAPGRPAPPGHWPPGLAEESTGAIVLAPATTVPLREAWLHENPKALKAVRTGIAQAGRGEANKGRSFAKHADDDAG
jgi:hypothetical protein